MNLSIQALGYEQTLTKILSGIFSDQKICKDCPHRYSSEVPFSAISVDVRNHSNLTDSLHEYVKGDLLDGSNAYRYFIHTLEYFYLCLCFLCFVFSSHQLNSLSTSLQNFDNGFQMFHHENLMCQLISYESTSLQFSMRPGYYTLYLSL